jgi:hypothetical protein
VNATALLKNIVEVFKPTANNYAVDQEWTALVRQFFAMSTGLSSLLSLRSLTFKEIEIHQVLLIFNRFRGHCWY